MSIVQANSSVLAHYVMNLSDQSVAESTYHEQQPVKFVMGDGSLSEPLEQALLGKAVGDKTTVELAPQDAFGSAEPDKVMNLPRSHFPEDMELSEGLIVSFHQPNGVEVPGMIRRLMGDLVLVDFNHPLAGQTVTLTLEIMEIL
jgi:FKBP-type peptidyl-prolyl cis-trans isomerase SlpA